MPVDLQLDRRQFLKATSGGVAAMAVPVGLTQFANAADAERPMIVDTHMHVWADDPKQYPFPHPYSADFKEPMHPGTVEMLIEDMDKYGCTHAVLVQVIFHGWDNTYIADCVKRYPDRLRAHGLIDPTDPKVADKLEYWMKEHGLHGMRFSPIYYKEGQHGGDAWLDADETHKLWNKAAELDAVLNFFIS
ncbi:MAG: amidohydrolase family protein, partial [Planctomycetaceae bacterium]|nr:amidohydrolase family protein [Planctomycetaceae bacterium]